jgi:ABC-type transport system involved in cytochrome bd biosynthesis fused ATPase/permease subunit
MRNDEPEDIEKIRQAIMRYRELLDVAKSRLIQHEQIYERLFTELTPEQRALSEKLQQREAAIIAIEDLDPLRQALLRASFDLRDIHREFEETYNNIAPQDTDE